MACIKIDQTPGNVAILLKRGYDMRPFTIKFKAVDFSAYTWSATILNGVTVAKTLTVSAAYDGTDTTLTVSGLTAAESTALPSTPLTWLLKSTAPAIYPYLTGQVTLS